MDAVLFISGLYVGAATASAAIWAAHRRTRP